MSSSDHGDKKPLESVLWRDDWGIAEADLTKEEATRQGLVLLRGRWVPESDKLELDKLLTAKRSVRTGSTLWIVVVVIVWAIIFIPYFVAYGSPGPDPVLLALLLAVLSVHIASGIALRSYQKWAWYVVSVSLAFGAAAFVAVGVLVGALSHSLARDLPLLLLGFCLPAALCGYLLSRLLKREVRQIFQKDRLPIIQGLKPVARFGPVFRLLGVGALILLNVMLDVHWYGAYHNRHNSGNTACDRTATADVSRLGAAIERLQNEMVDSNCHVDSENLLEKGLNLEYLVGPYYGWSGTSQKCQVLVRVVGHEVQACSAKGARPDPNPSYRYIYRQTFPEGKDLPAQVGPCEGKSYGGPEDNCYTSSMVGPDCTLHRPKESKKCKEIKEGQ